MDFLIQLFNGLQLGSIYALIALGYTMVYGVAKLINFAHGDIIMVGAYTIFFVVQTSLFRSGLPLYLAIIPAIIACTLLGVIIERIAYFNFNYCYRSIFIFGKFICKSFYC